MKNIFRFRQHQAVAECCKRCGDETGSRKTSRDRSEGGNGERRGQEERTRGSSEHEANGSQSERGRAFQVEERFKGQGERYTENTEISQHDRDVCRKAEGRETCNTDEMQGTNKFKTTLFYYNVSSAQR